MDEAEQIVLAAMEQAGVVLPAGVMGVQDIGPAALISMCSQALALAGVETHVYMPGSLPKSASDRFRVCTSLVDQIKLLGYRDELSFHQFLYPNKTDVHRLLRFLVQKLSKSSPESKGGSRRRRGLAPTKQPEEDETASAQPDELVQLEERLKLLKQQLAEKEETGFQLRKSLELDKEFVEEIERTEALEAKLALLREAVDAVQGYPGSPLSAMDRLDVATKECQRSLSLEQEQSASAMATMATEIRRLEQERSQSSVDAALRRELEELAAKIREREKEQAFLSLELEKLPKQASRSSYVRRITELVKNSKKQDADTAKIVSDTRELQRESNATQERLHRIHALVDELVFREAKKDAVCRMAYRLLSSMHESFTDLTNKVFEMDKLEREVADLQAELETSDKNPVGIAKVQADLDSVRAENLSLELKSRVVIASPLQV